MSAELLPVVAPLYLTALVLLALIALALSQGRTLSGAHWFAAFMGGVAVWTVAYAAEITLPGLEEMLLTVPVQYVGIALAPAAWLAFSADYSGLTWWNRRTEIAVFTIPVLSVLLTATNDLHQLMWTEASVVRHPSFTVLEFRRGVWFWVHVAYSYTCLLVAAGLYMRAVLTRPPLFRSQATFLLLGGLAPWAGNVLYLTGVSGGVDLTVYGFAVSGLCAGWAMFRWRLLSVGPVARDFIVEGMGQAVLVADPEACVVDLNPAMTRLLGVESREALGRPAQPLLSGFDVHFADEPVRHTIARPSSGRSYEVRVTPIEDHRHRLRGWTVLLFDVTEREEEARALEEARSLAQETARAQRSFITKMNHELRTPLNGVLGMLDLLEGSRLDAEQRTWVNLARESGRRLDRLVAQVLAFGSLEGEGRELEREPFLVRPIAADVVEGHRETAEAEGTRLELTVARSVPLRVVGDAEAVARVLDALVENAVKFTRQGRVQVRVAPDSEAADAGSAGASVHLRFGVEDTGVGIPEDRWEAVFDDFVQGDDSLTRRHEGAGLGLPLARTLVERMGGELRFESEVGRGSHFWFTLPLPLPPERESPPRG